MGFAGIKTCMEAKGHVDEGPYEVSLDNYGCCDGPKNGRLRALSNVSPFQENEKCINIKLLRFPVYLL